MPQAGEEDDEALLLDSVAQAAARFIAGLGHVPLIGVSWGRTMSAVAKRLPPFWNEGVEVVLLNGAMNIRSPSVRTNNTAELFARSANGTATLLPVPGHPRPCRDAPCARAGPDHAERARRSAAARR